MKSRSSYCIVRRSSKLKRVLHMQIKRSGKTLREIGVATSINEKNISAFTTGSKPTALGQYAILKLCDYLGIEISLKIKLKGEEL